MESKRLNGTLRNVRAGGDRGSRKANVDYFERKTERELNAQANELLGLVPMRRKHWSEREIVKAKRAARETVRIALVSMIDSDRRAAARAERERVKAAANAQIRLDCETGSGRDRAVVDFDPTRLSQPVYGLFEIEK